MKIERCFVVLLVILINSKLICAKDVVADSFAQDFYKHFKSFFESNQTDATLERLKDDMVRAEEKSIKLVDFPVQANARVCLKCYVAAHSFVQLKKSSEYGNSKIKSFMRKLCTYADIDNDYVCKGNIDINFPFANFIFGNKPNLTAEHVCAKVMSEYYCVKNDDTYDHMITVEKPVHTESKKYNFVSSNNLTILHLSDFHYDRYYAVGSSSQCKDWVCCRGDQVPPNSDSARAGYWGDYNICDSPGRLAENILQQITSMNQQIDIVYFTGDFVDHFGWNITREHCKYEIKYVTDLLKQYLPNIPIFPILGNHEGYPANFFAPNYIKDKELSSEWLYRFVADQWKDWLTDEARRSLANRGFYTMIIRDKLRLVALNSNICNVDNLWIVYDELFYREQLLWLIEILKTAAVAGEKVHIIGHVASNHERCDRKWTMDLNNIIQRYAPVIAGHFNGHSHLDEFVLYRTSEGKEAALNVAWNGGSGTNFVGLNSNFKFYYVDKQSYEVLDFDTWIFNLTQANLAPGNTPTWYKEYSFKSYFNVSDLSPSSIQDLLIRFKNDKNLLRKYWEVTIKQSDPQLKKGCNDECLQNTLSSITRTTFLKLNIYKGEHRESEKSVVRLDVKNKI